MIGNESDNGAESSRLAGELQRRNILLDAINRVLLEALTCESEHDCLERSRLEDLSDVADRGNGPDSGHGDPRHLG